VADSGRLTQSCIACGEDEFFEHYGERVCSTCGEIVGNEGLGSCLALIAIWIAFLFAVGLYMRVSQ